ncbi:unnamed protein product [Orchesella dallaii]|uniref:Uncharacterized protein n=1 Tax=Orchesella dallaii TaxID=48710 RepID=A0ABP1QVW9_9HEXA
MIQFKLAFVCFVFATVLATAVGEGKTLRSEDVAEPCLGNFITQDYKDGWTNSDAVVNSTVFFPLTTKYHAILLSKNLFQTQEFETVTDAHIQGSCISSRRIDSWPKSNVTGYNGTSFTMLMSATNVARLYRFHLGFPDVVTGGGYASIALTDNESYNLFDFCFDNGLRSFAVASTKKALDQNTQNIIKAHVKSLGFQEKNFLNLNYDGCTEKDGVLSTSGNELPKPAEPQTLLLYRTSPIFTKKYVLPSYFYKKA